MLKQTVEQIEAWKKEKIEQKVQNLHQPCNALSHLVLNENGTLGSVLGVCPAIATGATLKEEETKKRKTTSSLN